MGDFTKLEVWKKAHELTVRIYERTARWPRHELFGLTSQTRRAAASIAANIAGLRKKQRRRARTICPNIAGFGERIVVLRHSGPRPELPRQHGA